MKEQDKITLKQLKEIEASNMHDKEFEVMVIKVLTSLERKK